MKFELFVVFAVLLCHCHALFNPITSVKNYGERKVTNTKNRIYNATEYARVSFDFDGKVGENVSVWTTVDWHCLKCIFTQAFDGNRRKVTEVSLTKIPSSFHENSNRTWKRPDSINWTFWNNTAQKPWTKPNTFGNWVMQPIWERWEFGEFLCVLKKNGFFLRAKELEM